MPGMLAWSTAGWVVRREGLGAGDAGIAMREWSMPAMPVGALVALIPGIFEWSIPAMPPLPELRFVEAMPGIFE